MLSVVRQILIPAMLLLLAGCSETLTDTEYADRAQDYLDKGELQAASIELKNALQQNQNNPQARRLLGVVHLRAGDAAGAEKELRLASELGVADEVIQPLLAQALLAQEKFDALDALPVHGLAAGAGRGEVLAAQGLGRLARNNVDEAKDLIDAAFATAPESSFVGLARAKLFAKTKQKDAALQALDQVLERDKTYAPAWAFLGDLRRAQKHLDEAESAYTHAIENRFANTSDYVGRAFVRISLGKYEAARKDVDLLLRRKPKNHLVNYALGLIELHDNNLQLARDALERTLKINRHQLLPKYYLALVNFRLGNIEQADDSGEQAFAEAPTFIPIRELLAAIKLKKGLFDQARDLVRPIVEQHQENARAADLMASALLGEGKVEEALPLLEKLTGMKPESAVAQMRLGAAELALGQPEKGIPHLQASIAKDPELHQARLILLRYFVARKQMDRAMQVAEDYREVAPTSPAPWDLIGGLKLQGGDEDGARTPFEKALQLSPGDVAASHALASMAAKHKDFEKARGLYEGVLAQHKDHLATLLRLALLDALEKKEDAMVAHLEQAVSAHPLATAPRVMLGRYYLSKNQPGKVANLMLELKEQQRNKPDVLEVLGRAQLAQRQYRGAAFNLKELLKAWPKSATAHFLMAKAYGGQNERAKMKKELQRAVELAPKHLQAHLALARLALLQKDVVAAQARLTELEKIAPGNPDVLFFKAELADAEGDRKTASNLIQEVFRKAPNTRTMLAAARQEWAMGNPEEALVLQEKWIQEHPDDVVASLALAGGLSQKGNVDEALAQYEGVLAKDPKNVVALNDMAWQLRDKDPGKALELAQRAAELAPESARVLDTLAMVQSSNKQHQKALRSIERALEKAPGNPAMIYHSALISSAAGDREMARMRLKNLLAGKAEFVQRKAAEQMLKQLSNH